MHIKVNTVLSTFACEIMTTLLFWAQKSTIHNFNEIMKYNDFIKTKYWSWKDVI